MTDFNLSDHSIVLTGGLGILGRAMARRLLEAGARVTILDVRADTPDVTRTLFDGEHAKRIRGIACDLSDEASINAACTEIFANGPVQGLINNAATKGSDWNAFMKGPADMSAKTWNEVMAVNLDGAFLITKQVGQHMIEIGAGGSILFISSIYGIVGPDRRIYDGSSYNGARIETPPVYSASKAGVVGLSRYLATVWGENAIRVNCLCPGGVSSGQNEGFERSYSQRVPLKRMAQPDDIAQPAVFLLSDAAAYITGQTIAVDGGLTAW